MKRYLLDTNVVAEFEKPRPHARVCAWVEATEEDALFLSVLTIGEIRRGIAMLAPGPRRVRLEDWMGPLKARFSGRVLGVDDAIAERWGSLDGAARAVGRPLPVIDGLLAATALHHNLVLVTRNTADVAAIGVSTLNPWS